MYLQKLEIQGFKSFAHKTKLEFNRGVACVVGPNGSGKSNIADAVRWVLGEQSVKLLRGKKAQDVIFAGSKTKTRLGFAQVDIHLNNEDRSAPIDYSEVVISRRLYRDGESEYLINKNKVRLQDIIMLLAKANVGQRSYSVVGQGAVDKILSSTPYERKDFFDEATGVKQFQIKREEAVKKLDHTRDNLQQAEMLIQEIDPRLRSLTRQVKRLERREVIEEELQNLQKDYYGRIWQEILNEHRRLENKSQDESGQKRKVENELESIQKELDQLSRGQTRNEIFSDLQKQYNELLEQKNSLLQKKATLKGRLEIEQQKVGGHDLVYLEKRKEELASEQTKLNAELQELAGTISLKTKELEELLSKVNKMKKQDKMDLSSDQDLSIAIMNLVSIEEHLFFTAQKT
ncbi:AAA family ATPase, partial [Patescibacteria group bacterium]|nr:AAA family ATPase [Patescibacteria group bacterium]